MCSGTLTQKLPEKKLVRWPPHFFTFLHPCILYESYVKRNKLLTQNEKMGLHAHSTLTKLCMRVNIDDYYLLVKVQGRWVKGQGQINNFMKNWFC